jgi:hypothetical protein
VSATVCPRGCGTKVALFGMLCAPCLEAEDWAKVLSFAASAGDTISTGEAIEIIRAIARRRVDTHRAWVDVLKRAGLAALRRGPL